MSEYEALLAAICADPDEDTLRLAFADWLDEHDDPARAAFVRGQVELARTPSWEPFTVQCRWRRPDLVSGSSFRYTLPEVNGSHFEWPPDAFRRGLPWRLHLRSMYAWPSLEPKILHAAPIGDVSLGVGTLDNWMRFASSPVVRTLRHVHFVNNPNEPLRVLREQPEALGITDLFFDRASGAGMPEVLEDLFASPLGRVVRGLHFRMGYESLEHLIAAFGDAGRVERLSFAHMGLTADLIDRLADTNALSNLTALDLRGELLGFDGVSVLAAKLPASLQDLSCTEMRLPVAGVEAIAQADRLTGLKRLDLSRNPLTPRATKVLRQSRSFSGLRSLALANCGLSARSLRHVTHAKFWPNLVELDLRANPFGEAGIPHLLDAPVPQELRAMAIDEQRTGPSAKAELRKKYGERLVFGHEQQT